MLNELLEFESDSQIFDFRINCGKELIWPYVRNYIFENSINKHFNLQDAYSQTGLNKKNRILNHASMILDSFKKNPFRNSNKDILMFTSDSTNIKINKEMYFDRIQEYFARVFPNDTLIIELHTGSKHHSPRMFKNISYEDYLSLIIKLKSKFSILDKEDEENINKFVFYIKKKLPIQLEDKDYKNIEYILQDVSKKLVYYNMYYKKLFNLIKPKIIFFENGFYGKRAAIIKVANEMNIVTCEFQHGLVSLNHTAYNYSNFILHNDEFNMYLPKYYLTYGEYWNENIRIPSEKVIVGNPYFEEKISKLGKSNRKCDEDAVNNILIVSQGSISNVLLKITEGLAKNLANYKNYKIIYRLHPGEIPHINRYNFLNKYKNVEVDYESNIYELINMSQCVVGVYSTTLFEAIGLNKKILIYDDAQARRHIDYKIGNWFKNEFELVKLILNDEEKEFMTVENKRYYWQDRWEERYVEFINDILNKKSTF